MLRVLLISGLVALSLAATVLREGGDTDATEGCMFTNQIWGGNDPTKFYFCYNGMAIEQNCDPNTFFVRNATTSGCVPLALVEPKCVNLQPVETCAGANLKQPQPAANPNQYYLCPSLNADPILLTCPAGKAFVKKDGYMGCFEWTQWRTLTGCPE